MPQEAQQVHEMLTPSLYLFLETNRTKTVASRSSRNARTATSPSPPPSLEGWTPRTTEKNKKKQSRPSIVLPQARSAAALPARFSSLDRAFFVVFCFSLRIRRNSKRPAGPATVEVAAPPVLWRSSTPTSSGTSTPPWRLRHRSRRSTPRPRSSTPEWKVISRPVFFQAPVKKKAVPTQQADRGSQRGTVRGPAGEWCAITFVQAGAIHLFSHARFNSRRVGVVRSRADVRCRTQQFGGGRM